jgi:hypothetical protein
MTTRAASEPALDAAFADLSAAEALNPPLGWLSR